MIAHQVRQNREVQQRLKKWNSSNIEELSKVMQTKRSSKAMWPEQSPQAKEISRKGTVSSDEGVGSKKTYSTPQPPDRGQLENAQQLQIDLTEENRSPVLVI